MFPALICLSQTLYVKMTDEGIVNLGLTSVVVSAL